MSRIDDAMYEVAISDKIGHDEKVKIIQQLQKALPTDRWTLRYIVIGLIIIVLLPLLFMFWAYVWYGYLNTTEIPQGILSLASTALGALAAYITPRQSDGNQGQRSTPDSGTANTGTADTGAANTSAADTGAANTSGASTGNNDGGTTP